MFRPEKMCLVSISVLDEYLTQVLDRLAKMGVMHVVDKKEIPSSVEGLEEINVEPVRNKLVALNDRVESLLTMMSIGVEFPFMSADAIKEKIEINPLQIAEKIEEEISSIESELNPIMRRQSEIQAEITELEDNSHQLSFLEAPNISLEVLKEGQFLYFTFGDIPEEYYDRLASSLANTECVLVPGEIAMGRQQVMAFSIVSEREVLSDALEGAYFSRAKIPERYHGLIIDVLDEIEVEIWVRREEMAELQGKLRSLRQDWRDNLLELHATIAANQVVIGSMEKFSKIERSYFISGWVPYSDVKSLQKEVGDISKDGIVIEASEPITAKEAEHYKPKVPTKLKHPSFLRPFEGLVRNFGIPRYSDIDPTPFASITFLAMFGIMFADVGHGGVLLLLGLLGGLYPLPQLKPVRQMALFIASCGVASMIFGFVFGSIFGMEIIHPLWFSLEEMGNPEAVNRMLKLGVYFGVGMLSLSTLLNISQAFRRKNLKEAICGQWGIFSLLFYWTVVFMMVMFMSGSMELSWRKVLVIVILLLPIMLKEPVSRLLGRKPEHFEEEEEAESMIESGFEIYEMIMAYLANTLSYIRMAAFNLSHAGLMMASYALTRELGGGGSLLLSLPSNIMANAFVIMLEGLIVSIQCMRLEYYEFFSKFFAGEGIEYKPMKIGR